MNNNNLIVAWGYIQEHFELELQPLTYEQLLEVTNLSNTRNLLNVVIKDEYDWTTLKLATRSDIASTRAPQNFNQTQQEIPNNN